MNKSGHTTEIIWSEAGRGKTRHICEVADKENDIVICVSLDNKGGYVEKGFKNVMTY